MGLAILIILFPALMFLACLRDIGRMIFGLDDPRYG
jgi:hypothetical protein